MNTASLSDRIPVVLRREGSHWSREEVTEFCFGLTDDPMGFVRNSLARVGQMGPALDVNRTYRVRHRTMIEGMRDRWSIFCSPDSHGRTAVLSG